MEAGDVDKDDGCRLADCIGGIQTLPSGKRSEGSRLSTVFESASLFLPASLNLDHGLGEVAYPFE